MTQLGRSRRLLTAVAGTVAAMVVLSACGGSEITAQTPNTAVEGAAGNVPDVPAVGADDAATVPGSEGASTVPGAEGAITAPGEIADPGAVSKAPTDKAASPKVPGTRAAKNARAAAGETKNAPAAAGEKGGPAKPNTAVAPTAAGGAVAQTIATAPIFGGSGTCKPATLSEVAIGNVSTLSGVLGELFGPVRPALETFVASQNACGGLNGHKIKFFIDDDQGDPATAVTKVQNMIQNNKVLAFVGHIQPLTVDAIVPTIKKAGIPIIGSDITNNTWFTNPLFFPQGPPGQSISYGFLKATKDYFKKQKFGHIWCIEVPRACEQIDRAAKEMAPQVGVDFVKSIQVSITAPSYVQQCLDFKQAGVEVLGMSYDAASMNRLAKSCTQVGFFPNLTPYPLGVGNEKQYFGNKWLGNAYIPLNSFPWMGTTTAPEKYYQAAVAKFNPGFASGGSASLGWSAGALLVAASAGLAAENPTTQQFLDTLYSFKGQEFTKAGGLFPSPLTFSEGASPKVPYCLFAAITNAANTGWAKPVSKPVCTDIIAPSDPQGNS